MSKIAYAWLLIERLPPLINIFGLPFATLSPITLIPGNFPTITSNKVVAAGDIVKLDEGLDIALFLFHEQKIKSIIVKGKFIFHILIKAKLMPLNLFKIFKLQINILKVNKIKLLNTLSLGQ